MMQFSTISGRYFVTSHGNGWAYEVEDTATGETVWAQDSDADAMREHCADFENEAALSDYFGLEV